MCGPNPVCLTPNPCTSTARSAQAQCPSQPAPRPPHRTEEESEALKARLPGGLEEVLVQPATEGEGTGLAKLGQVPRWAVRGAGSGWAWHNDQSGDRKWEGALTPAHGASLLRGPRKPDSDAPALPSRFTVSSPRVLTGSRESWQQGPYGDCADHRSLLSRAQVAQGGPTPRGRGCREGAWDSPTPDLALLRVSALHPPHRASLWPH